MTCLKELTRDILVDALTCHQKVMDHPCIGSISFLEVQGEHQVLICQEVINHCHLDEVCFSLYKKNIGIP